MTVILHGSLRLSRPAHTSGTASELLFAHFTVRNVKVGIHVAVSKSRTLRLLSKH